MYFKKLNLQQQTNPKNCMFPSPQVASWHQFLLDRPHGTADILLSGGWKKLSKKIRDPTAIEFPGTLRDKWWIITSANGPISWERDGPRSNPTPKICSHLVGDRRSSWRLREVVFSFNWWFSLQCHTKRAQLEDYHFKWSWVESAKGFVTGTKKPIF